MSAARGGAPGRPPLALVCAADDAFAHSVAAMLHSVAAHLSRDRGLRVFVLDDGLRPESRARLERVAAGLPVPAELCWIHPDLGAVAGFRTLPAWPHTIYFRLLAGALLPPELDRVVYLDTDVTVRADLCELWDAPLDGCAVGAVRNHLPACVGGEEGIPAYAELGLDPAAPYLNSGLLLIDLARWRAERVGERALEYVRTHPDDLFYPDQEALNAALAGRWKVLPPEWNVLTSIYWLGSWPDSEFRREVEADEWKLLHAPKLVHFSGKEKPWMPGCPHPLKELYLHHLRESGWDAAASALPGPPAPSPGA